MSESPSRRASRLLATLVLATAMTTAAPVAYGANPIPTVQFTKPGATYDSSTIQVVSGDEGTREVTGTMPRGGFVLTAVATNVTVVYTESGSGQSVFWDLTNAAGILPLASSYAPDAECSSQTRVNPRLDIGIFNAFPNPRAGTAPRRNGVVATLDWRALGCRQSLTSTTSDATWPIADGRTTWTVSRLRSVTVRPARTHRVWASDWHAFWRWCINGTNSGPTLSIGDRAYCVVTDQPAVVRRSYRLTQRTTIKQVYPAYVTP